MTVRITVLGSINLDLVATAETLPSPGETVINAVLTRHPGGKGANQALAAQRLGAQVTLIGRVGADAFADEAMTLLRAEGVDLHRVTIDPAQPTAVALIAVSKSGENQIVLASGANGSLAPDLLGAPITEALICQLEMPVETVIKAALEATGFVCLNLAPALPVPDSLLARANLIVVNEGEAAVYGDRIHQARGLVAVTWGARGAGLYRQGVLVAEATPPVIEVVDSTGAGDSFVAALALALIEDQALDVALKFACTTGALTTTKLGAQTSLPHRRDVEAALSQSAE
jgi:ribokinase